MAFQTNEELVEHNGIDALAWSEEFEALANRIGKQFPRVEAR
nr:hypothetical protein [Thermoactinomyces mirandus]